MISISSIILKNTIKIPLIGIDKYQKVNFLILGRNILVFLPKIKRAVWKSQ